MWSTVDTPESEEQHGFMHFVTFLVLYSVLDTEALRVKGRMGGTRLGLVSC